MRTAKNESERQAISDIKNHGLHIIHVFEDEEHPCFSYTIGLYENYLHSEILIVGLKQELAHVLLNNMAFEIKNEKNYAVGEFYEDVLDDFLCYFDNVPKTEYKEYVGWAIWFYEGYDFPLIQCVYPTVKGIFPWESNLPDDAKFFMKMLIEPPREH